eukprot:6894178-Prymnesium_polylepis.1
MAMRRSATGLRRSAVYLLLARRFVASASSDAEALALGLRAGWPSDAPEGSKRLSFIRHAEGWHNKDSREKENYYPDRLGETMTYWDARITPLGTEQAELLSHKLQWRQRDGLPQLVAVSPLTRTLETACLAFPDESVHGWRPPFFATSLARERIAEHTCDGRRPLSELKFEFPHVDFSEITSEEDEMWEHKEDTPSPQESTACMARGRRLLRWLWERPEKDIAIVTHWVFLSHLFRQFPLGGLQKNFGNAEMRFVTLVPNGTVATADHDEL